MRCRLQWDPSKLHHVAAKCGVFAETDIVNLVKSGIPSSEILCSLADAIVSQNLSVLTRGNTLKPRVLLLGGPNTYLPFLQACWRQRIPETWKTRGFDWPKDMPDRGADLRSRGRAVLRGATARRSTACTNRRTSACTAAWIRSRSSSPTAARRKLGANRRPAACRDRRRARSVPRGIRDPEVCRTRRSSRARRARRHRPRRRLDVVESGAARRGRRDPPDQAVPAVEGQSDRRHQGAARADQGVRPRSGRDARGARLRRDRLCRRCPRGIAARRRQHRRDGRAHDRRGEVFRRRRRDLRHRRAGHQGPVHDQRRDPEFPALQPVLGRQRDAAAGDGESVRRAGHRVRGRRVQGAAQPEVQLRLRGVPRRRPRELPEGRLLEGGAARRAGDGAAEERVAVRRADSAAGAAGTRYVLQGGTQYNLAAVKAQVDYIKARVPERRAFACIRIRAKPARSAPRSKRSASCSGAGTRRSSASTPRSISATRA